jgi:hypothetical protein
VGNKSWTTPELVVLVRHRPQEAVLQFCKFDNVVSMAPGTYFYDCHDLAPDGLAQECMPCFDLIPT